MSPHSTNQQNPTPSLRMQFTRIRRNMGHRIHRSTFRRNPNLPHTTLHQPTTLLRTKLTTQCQVSDSIDITLTVPQSIYFAGRNKDGYLQLTPTNQHYPLGQLHHQHLLPGHYVLELHICSNSIPTKGTGFVDTRWMGWWIDPNDSMLIRILEIETKQEQIENLTPVGESVLRCRNVVSM